MSAATRPVGFPRRVWWHMPAELRPYFTQSLVDQLGPHHDWTDMEPHPRNHKRNKEALRLASDEFRCAVCRGVFTKAWSEEEAEAERQALFSGTPEEDCDLVCDPCFKKMGLSGQRFHSS